MQQQQPPEQQPREWVTATEAVEVCGLSLRTVTAYLTDEKKRGKHLPGAKRAHTPGGVWHWEIPIAEVQALRRAAARSATRKSQQARIDELEQRVADLEARLAALEARGTRQPAARRHAEVLGDGSGATLSDLALGALQAHPARRLAKLPGEPPPGVPWLPADWVAVSTLARTFNLSQQTMDRAEVNGEIPAPHRGKWWTGKQTAKLVYDAEQQAAVLVWARAKWPEKFEREPVPTVKRPATLSEFGSDSEA